MIYPKNTILNFFNQPKFKTVLRNKLFKYLIHENFTYVKFTCNLRSLMSAIGLSNVYAGHLCLLIV